MPVAFAEVYMALQQGMADGQENPVPTIQAMGFHEVQRYLNLTGHIQSSIQILVNDQVWQRLSADQQDALEQSIRELGKQVYDGTLHDEQEILSRWRDEKVLQVIEDVDRTRSASRARQYFACGLPLQPVVPEDQCLGAVAIARASGRGPGSETNKSRAEGGAMKAAGERLPSNRLVRWLVTIERLLATLLLLTILGSMSAQVVARYVLHSPISWSEEWARFALIWLAFLAAAFVMAEGQHIAVDVVSQRLGPRGRQLLECISNTVVVLACVLLLTGGFRFVWRVGLVDSPALGIPRSYWYGAASTGVGLIALHGIANILAVVRSSRSESQEPAADDQVSADSRGAS
jgi:TRAP-type transport system small permease protein